MSYVIEVCTFDNNINDFKSIGYVKDRLAWLKTTSILRSAYIFSEYEAIGFVDDHKDDFTNIKLSIVSVSDDVQMLADTVI